MNRSERSGLQVDEHLRAFVEDELLSEVELDAKDFWSTLARLQERFAPRIADALARRDDVQARIDAWHAEHGVGSRDDYEALLSELGYLAPEPSSAPTIDVDRVDPEVAEVPGPQLVVPSTNARFALNAANARWGSLFDAFYGTDALPQDHELAKGYDERRGAQVIAAADDLLDELFPLATGSHRDVSAYRPSTEGLVADTANHGTVGLADPSQFAGFNAGDGTGNVLLVRNGLHVDLVIDPTTQVGRQHHADVSDVVLESAVTTIVDLEDSVATVDGEDKALAYRTWLGLMTGNLVAEFRKGGETVTRRVNPDREYTGADGNPLTLQGRSMMLVRNCGHHMTTDAVLTADGQELAEGVLDVLVSAVAGAVRPAGHRPAHELARRVGLHRQAEAARPGGGRADRRAVRRRRGGARPGHEHAQDRHHGRGEADDAQPVRRDRRGRQPGDLRQHRLPGPHRRRDPHLLRGRSGVAQGRHEVHDVAADLRGPQRRRRPRGRVQPPRPDRQGHVGQARRDGRDARAEDRPAEGGREHGVGAVADGRDAARAALPAHRRARRPGGDRRSGTRPTAATCWSSPSTRACGSCPTRTSATSWRRTRSPCSATSSAGSGWASAARPSRTWRAPG